MARHPFSDECSVIPETEPWRKGDRIFTKELAAYLRHGQGDLHRYARARGLLHYTYRAPGRVKVWWVTPRTAMRLIAYARAIQGKMYLEGKDFHRRAELANGRAQKSKQKKKAAEGATALGFSVARALNDGRL